MLPTKHADAYTPASTSDYLSLAAREPGLPPTLADFMTLLGPGAKERQAARQAALSACIRHLQTGAPEAPSIQLWLLVTYAPALQAMAGRYHLPAQSREEVHSSIVMAFLETLLNLSEKRLADAYLEQEIANDARRRLAYHEGLWQSNRAERVTATPDEALMADSLPDDRADAYQALQDLILDMPITDAERSVLVGLYVYGYTLHELAAAADEDYFTVQKRHKRLLKRLRERNPEES
ncbi:MAG: hypothetical protein Q8O14_14860 [bacterium]|nr:hypothetical protein [bacterium]